MLAESRNFAAHRSICQNVSRACRPLVLAVLCLSLVQPLAAQQVVPKLGHALTALPAPVAGASFTLQDTDEETHALADYRGKVILLNFWATWCPPCRREIPSMERLYQLLREDGFVVLAVNQWEDPDHVFAYLGQLEADPSFPILFDPESEVAKAYGVKGLPTTFLLDKDGKVRYRAVGGREFDHPEVVATIRRLLK